MIVRTCTHCHKEYTLEEWRKLPLIPKNNGIQRMNDRLYPHYLELRNCPCANATLSVGFADSGEVVRFDHGCARCEYLGAYEQWDLYYCLIGHRNADPGSVLARFGNNPRECVTNYIDSIRDFSNSMQGTHAPGLKEAYRRYLFLLQAELLPGKEVINGKEEDEESSEEEDNQEKDQ